MKESADVECTVGVTHIPGSVLFFKNRDLSAKYALQRISSLESCSQFCALGGVDLRTGRPQGVSIGVNRHGVCVANTHVVSSKARTYDLLCEEILRQARRKNQISGIVQDFVRRGSVQGGRVLVAGRCWVLLIEVVERQFQIQEVSAPFVITNTFSLLSYPEQKSTVRLESSDNRQRVAERLIEGVSSLGALQSILRSHIPEKGELSICNHRSSGGGTVSSHVVQLYGNTISWSSCEGFPCENEYSTTRLF